MQGANDLISVKTSLIWEGLKRVVSRQLEKSYLESVPSSVVGHELPFPDGHELSSVLPLSGKSFRSHPAISNHTSGHVQTINNQNKAATRRSLHLIK